MKICKCIAVLLVVCGLTVGMGTVSAAAEEEWSWANYGFSDLAIANPDPFDATSYLIGGYVATVNYKHLLPESYIYRASILLDTEGVAVRFRFSWTNSEQGFKAVADLSDGIAIYPMDESLDIVIVTEGGEERFSFPVPGAYDYMKANDYCVMDDGSILTVSLCGKVVAILKLSGAQKVGRLTYYEAITVTDGDGYVYGRVTGTRVLTEKGYVGYSSAKDRALILVKEHSIAEADIAFEDLPEERETVEGWIPETEAKVTETVTEPATSSETEDVTVAPTETETETDIPTAAEGCGGMLGMGAGLLVAGGALVLGKKKD